MSKPVATGNGVSIGLQTSRSNTPLPAINNDLHQSDPQDEVKFENTGLVTDTPLPSIIRDSALTASKLKETGNKTASSQNKLVSSGTSDHKRIYIDTGQNGDYYQDKDTVITQMEVRKSNNMSVELMKLANTRKLAIQPEAIKLPSATKIQFAVSPKSGRAAKSVEIIPLADDSRVLTTPVSREVSPSREEQGNYNNAHKNTDKHSTSTDLNHNLASSSDGVKSSEANIKTNEGTSVPIIKVQQNAILNRGYRPFHGIAKLNAMRNKHVSFDQRRIAKRKEEDKQKSKSMNNLSSSNHISVGDLDLLSQSSPSSGVKRPLSVWGKGPSSDFTKKSGDIISRPSPQLSMSRSKTFSGGMMSKGTATPSIKETGTNDEEGSNVYEIKGSGLQKDPIPVNHNTPQPDDDILQTGGLIDRSKSPLNQRYVNGSAAHDASNKLPGLLTVDQANGTNSKLQSLPKRFKPKRDTNNSKVVLKYYSEGRSRKLESNGMYPLFTDNTSNHIRGIMSSSPAKSVDGSQADKKVSFKKENPNKQVSVARSTTVTTSNGPVSLTTRNLELFDQMSTVNNKTQQQQSALSFSADDEILNDRLMSWIQDRQKVLEPVEDEENVKDLNEHQLFSASYVFKHQVPAYQY